MDAEITREQLHAYLEEALSTAEMAKIENALRNNDTPRQLLRQVREELDRGEHSLGGVWRRERVSCLSRDQLSGYLHGILEADLHAYAEFHLKTMACPTCLANLDDLRDKQTESHGQARQRKQIFQSSAGLLKKQT
jgi:hypothetical protein